MLNLIIEYFISLALTIFLFLSMMYLIIFLGNILQRFRLETIYIALYELKSINKKVFINEFLYESQEYCLDIEMGEHFKEMFKEVFKEPLVILVLFLISLIFYKLMLLLGLINVILLMLIAFFGFFLFVVFKINEDVNRDKKLLRKQVIKIKEETLKGKSLNKLNKPNI